MKCDAMLERDLVGRKLSDNQTSREAPSFDLGVGQSQSFSFSNVRLSFAAYRAIRLSEVAGLPPTTNHKEFRRADVASGILKRATEELATSQLELAVRLVLRVCNYDKDETLMRILSRTRVAAMQPDTAETLAQMCTGLIEFALPRVLPAGTPRPNAFWVERMRVAMEVLSRLVLRLSPDMVETTLDNALLCYQNPRVSQEPWLTEAIEHLLQRSWETLPNGVRSRRSLDLLGSPIVGIDNFTGPPVLSYPDPGEFVQAEDLAASRTQENDNRWHDVISLLIRGLNGSDDSRKRAARRIRLVALREILTETELSTVAQALWNDKYTSPESLPVGTGLFDWVFLLLPEPDPGIAEQRFRLKWLSGDLGRFHDSTQGQGKTISVPIGIDPVNPDKIEDVL